MAVEYSPELFQQVPKDIASAEAIVRPSVTYWQDAWRRLKQNKMAMVGLWTIAAILLIAIFGPMVSPYSYSDQDLASQNQGPSRAHWLGTDDLGRDMLTRLMYGARISLTVGIMASVLNLTVGVIYGGISGYYGGRVDNIMMRIVEILTAIPMLLYVILLMVILEPGLQNILIALGVVYWLSMARIVRGQVLSLKEQDFVLAARTIGASDWRIILKHLVPNAMGPIIVTATLNIPSAIFTEAFLSFIGLGVSAPMASWGALASDALQGFRTYPWQLFYPAIAISITMFAFNFLGDGLRDALDPKQRK
ncbi:MAG: ABC transporter permease [Firmicutes bacterium]|nr:ABC transporter permease [Bacillota bacterium]